jgi:hypothetical protein
LHLPLLRRSSSPDTPASARCQPPARAIA